MKVKERVCRYCGGAGERLLGDEWTGAVLSPCSPCKGTGMELAGGRNWLVEEEDEEHPQNF